jgi:biotin transport system substrate-specific component
MSVETESVDLVGDEAVENVARAAVFAALTGAMAYVSFPNPVSPTDISLQVLGVFLAGLYLGPVWGGVSMSLYLAAGAVGAPVFLGGSSGVGALLGFTGGYLWSYPVAAALVGAVVHGTDELADPRSVSVVRLVAAMVAGTVVIYAFGTVGFAFVQNVSLYESFMVSAVAFIPAEAFKIAAAVGITRSEQLKAA